jgi:hypothetical protein
MADTEYFMVTVVDDMGNPVTAYVTSKEKHQYVQMMSSEYGNISIEPVEYDDLPQDVIEFIEASKK